MGEGAGTESNGLGKLILNVAFLGCYEGIFVNERRCILFSSLMYNLVHVPPLIFLPHFPSCPG